MIHVFSALKGLLQGKKIYIDHWVFRLHYRFTVLLLLFFCIIVSTKQYAGEPIKCSPDLRVYSAVVDTYCFITTTYTVQTAMNLTPSQGAPHPGVSSSQDESNYIYHAYYQWIGFLLFFQSVLFYFPHWLWKNFEGGKLSWLLERDIRFCSKEEKNKCKDLIISHLRTIWHIDSTYIFKYFLCEILCLVNLIGQMMLLDLVLNGQFYSFGIEAVHYLRNYTNLKSNPFLKVFPRVTSCTFRYFGETGKVRSVSVLCILAINIVNEKIFLILWFWFIILLIITSLAFIARVVIFFFKAVLLHFFRLNFRVLRPDDLRVITETGNMSNLLFVYFLGKNMEHNYFNDVIMDFVAILQGKAH
ncbi:innexin shaking-B-like [Stegodyphus dumicola]|uniref:innexin shaking-B-like n=1 Tax=Stegodyphus dumicola TaxID=202533 RepID=UPI0015B0E1DD|nr:innexin shaking-B-like [Stegodyphus dumicola]XP_035228753.1 innexin shaking-B-like [Stegodyphus dumicola]